jgi:hypothetical protein
MIIHPWEPRTGFYFGAAEQFSHFNTIQVDGHKIDNDADQYLDSSNTQLFLGYNITRRFGLQVNVPLIHRSFRRTVGDHVEKDSESGLGDVSLLASFVPIYHNKGDFTFMAKLTGGLKFPTGNSDRLAEEEEEGHQPGGEAEATHHEPAHAGVDHTEETALPESGIHGHDLALGSGSVDGIVGTSLYARFRRAFFSADVQYAIRSEGDHDYRYANDLTWSGGPGFYLKDDKDISFAVQFVCSGETKGKDKFRGVRADDTGLTAVYLGPKFSGTFRDRISADVELGIPVHMDNTALQIVPDYRVRAGLSVQF